MPKYRILMSTVAAVVIAASAASAHDLVKYEIVDHAIPKSLTGTAGDAKNGEKVFVNRRLGNCLSCHTVSSLSSQPFHGEIGPPLDGVAERYTEGQLRLQVVNAKAVNPDTIMPGFYRTDLFRVLKGFRKTPILTAQEVEDVIAYLKTLK